MLIMLAAGAAALAIQAAAPVYEGVARDGFAAWSYTSGEVKVAGQVLTTSVKTLYDTPTPFNGVPTPVAWSIHTVAFDCAAKTAAFIDGGNYSSAGVLIGPAAPAAAAPWTGFTPGFQQLAATVCTVGKSL
jgi:hypothetical protein